MLKHIPKVLSPELLKVLCEMGHSDCIVLADGNFPSQSVGKDSIVIRMDSCGIQELLDAILRFLPLDSYIEKPVSLMKVMDGDCVETPAWEVYKTIIAANDDRGEDAIGYMERFAFYEKAKKAYAIIATGDESLYANVMLQKGVVP